MKKFFKYLVLGAACLLLTGLPAGATSLEGELSDAKGEQSELEKERKSAQKTLDKLETKKDQLQDYIKEIDADLNNRQKEITKLSNDLAEKEDQLSQTEAELQAAVEKSERQYAAMKERIKFVYENGNQSYIELILKAKSFSDFINRAELVSQVYEYDKNMLLSYEELQKTIAATKEQLEADKKSIQTMQANAEYEKKQLQIVADAKEAQVKQYETDIEGMEEKIKEYDREIKEQNAIIRQLEEQVKKQKAAQADAGASTPKYTGGKFTWPCPSSTRITDEFGMRMHPTLHVMKMHDGIDIGAAYGSDIVAACEGTVVAAAYNSSMGNYVMIDHGGELYTIYMHCSSLNTSVGAKVKAGQSIAKVGSTGRSTGNHLHFGVRLNGSYVSPWNYLK